MQVSPRRICIPNDNLFKETSRNEDSPENIKNLYHCIRKINGHKVYDLKGPVPSKEEKIEIDEDGL